VVGIRIEMAAVSELSLDVARRIQATNEREFGKDSLVYAQPEWFALGFLKRRLVSRVGILQRTISVDGSRFSIGGISFVVTEPDYRGRGFASCLLASAVTFLRNPLQVPFGLLTCKPRLESLYSGLGWLAVPGPTVFDQPSGPHTCGGLTMVIECGGSSWPGGRIDLCGLPW
jgi:GNAT superfamily N-acetyltransferase